MQKDSQRSKEQLCVVFREDLAATHAKPLVLVVQIQLAHGLVELADQNP